MTDDHDFSRRQLSAEVRERRRGLHRLMVVVLVLGAVATLVSAGALTWVRL
ncbi:hypothetical protein [Methylobacterium sp. sgz302541]|uniref:hypothetical protein n=1 Tax=unclassified Methylobacterium TaxID=2615210 RepID=UPI003D33B09E